MFVENDSTTAKAIPIKPLPPQDPGIFTSRSALSRKLPKTNHQSARYTNYLNNERKNSTFFLVSGQLYNIFLLQSHASTSFAARQVWGWNRGRRAASADYSRFGLFKIRQTKCPQSRTVTVTLNNRG
jgi:hypothetical protein